MKYMLLIYADEAIFTKSSRAEGEARLGAYLAYTQALKDAGVHVAGDRLQPVATATTLRGSGGNTKVLDGPYAETREQLGGYYLIDVPDLDAALGWARRCPGTELGAVEVRPLWAM